MTKCMKQIPSWDVYGYSYSQEIPCVLWNSEIHYHGHKSSLLDPTLTQMNPENEVGVCFCNVDFNIDLPSMPRSPKWSLSFRLKLYKHFLSCLSILHAIILSCLIITCNVFVKSTNYEFHVYCDPHYS
jgi:hypothetical protein